MTEHEYIMAWVYYAAGATAFFAIFWYWIRNFLWAEVRQLMRVVLAIILVVPWYTDASHNYVSPAWIASIADALQHGPQAFWRAGLPLVIALVSALLLSTIYATYRWYSQRSKVQPAPVSE